MDIFLELWYSWVCETRRLCPTTGSAPHQSGGAFKTRPFLPSCGAPRPILHKFLGPLDAVLPAPRQGRLEAAPHAGPTARNDLCPKAGVDRTAEERPGCGRLSHRYVDHPACRRTNPPALGHRLSSGTRMEDSDCPWLELPETRTAGHPTQTQRNSPVEAAPVAAYKKKPSGWGRIWSSSMRAAFCSFRRCSALGRRWATRRCCGTAIGGIGSRLLEL